MTPTEKIERLTALIEKLKRFVGMFMRVEIDRVLEEVKGGEKLAIVFDEYDHKCGGGCCDHYGTTTTINGVELDCHNQDVGTIVKQIFTHLGIEAEVTTTYNGEGY